MGAVMMAWRVRELKPCSFRKVLEIGNFLLGFVFDWGFGTYLDCEGGRDPC